ncbi:MAG: hypothetical protein R2912_01270 [Eubacteriales bacterium]
MASATGLAYEEGTIGLTITPVDDAFVVTGTSKTIYEDSSIRFPTPGSTGEADGDSTTITIEGAGCAAAWDGDCPGEQYHLLCAK